jgi:hypothetical protein
MDKLISELKDTETRAWEALCNKKYLRFGYFASKWSDLNRLLDKPKCDPFSKLGVSVGKKVRF